MATISNRSRFQVSVRGRADLDRTFPFNRPSEVQTYVGQLKAAGFKPALSRLDDAYLVRIRRRGFPVFTATASSATEAEELVRTITQERR